MGFEIEFHPVGDGTKAGDAITVRYGQLGQYKVIVIDGGTEESGQVIVDHIRKYYGADAVVSDVISTHPDTDHCSGLRVVLRELPVERLWIHGLWYHAAEMLELFAEKRWTADGLAAAIRKEYPIVEELISLAFERGIPVHEPFAGAAIGPLTVLSPNKPTYQHLVPQFRKTPDCDIDLLKARGIWINNVNATSLGAIFKVLAEAVTNWIPETWYDERLQEGAVTAAENESSTVLYGNFDGSALILTADAGVGALNWACDEAARLGLDIASARLIQVPHHGSRGNVTPSTLNRLVGPILPQNSPEVKRAIVSAPKEDDKHPRKMVLNAFKRRGAGVRSTQGVRYRYHEGMPERGDENSAKVFGFFDQVEAYD
ncbi:MBL fold metallo-hydrolase [Herbaspirillum sp. HC18]|nr:MBL fold metallo-hydrolase [Herbaspirillum sp. HC18]